MHKIWFQDRHLVVLEKAAGMVMHDDCDSVLHTLKLQLGKQVGLWQCVTKNRFVDCSVLNRLHGTECIFPSYSLASLFIQVFGVHRLDKCASGLLVVGLSSRVADLLSSTWSSARKEYMCLVHDVPPKQKGLIDAPLGRRQLSPSFDRVVVSKTGVCVCFYFILFFPILFSCTAS